MDACAGPRAASATAIKSKFFIVFEFCILSIGRSMKSVSEKLQTRFSKSGLISAVFVIIAADGITCVGCVVTVVVYF